MTGRTSAAPLSSFLCTFILKNSSLDFPTFVCIHLISLLFPLKYISNDTSTALSLDKTTELQIFFFAFSGDKGDFFFMLCQFFELIEFHLASDKLGNFLFLKTAKFPPSSFAQSENCDPEGNKRRNRHAACLNFLIYEFCFPSSAVNRTSCDSVLTLSCICGVTLLSVKIF